MSPGAGGPAGMPCSEGLRTRREVLDAAGLLCLTGAGALMLAGCGVRLEDGVRTLPPRTRTPIADEGMLVAGFREAKVIAELANRVPGGATPASQLAGIHATQAEVLQGRLAAGGVPDTVVTAEPTGSASAPVAAPASEADLAAAERASVSGTALSAVAGATEANRPILAAIAAQRGAAAVLLRPAPTWPQGDPLPPSQANALLEVTRAVGYAIEVAAAQLAGDARVAALTTLSSIRVRERGLETMAGAAASPAPLGYVLPFPVHTPEAAHRLAATVLARLVDRGLDPVGQLPTGSSALAHVVRLQAEAQILSHQWGAPLLPFPGLAYP